jgi:hypothetical protein
MECLRRSSNSPPPVADFEGAKAGWPDAELGLVAGDGDDRVPIADTLDRGAEGSGNRAGGSQYFSWEKN